MDFPVQMLLSNKWEIFNFFLKGEPAGGLTMTVHPLRGSERLTGVFQPSLATII